MDTADEVWDQVADALERFLEAWERKDGADPPCPSEFAPSESSLARRLTLVELIKVDLEYRARSGLETKRLEDYTARFPDLATEGGLPADLIYEEYNVRRSNGEAVGPEEYFRRFPQQADSLRNLLGLEVTVSTSLGMAQRPDGIAVGDKIDDFDLLAELGSGAFASVFLARQRSLQRNVAVKISRNQGREPQTLAQLDHPHIVRVYDQRVLPDNDLRLLYMKYVPGGTLEGALQVAHSVSPDKRSGAAILSAVDAALDRRGEEPPLESAARESLAECDWPTAVCRLGAQLAEALQYAHEHGVLHRDLKPANILLTAEGSPQLVDFNISYCSKLDGATPTAYFGGSLAYMAPEQLEASNPQHERTPDSLDARSDVYSLGVVLWELLCGNRPFVDESFNGDWPGTLNGMVQARLNGPESESLAAVPAAIRNVLQRCLQFDPERRYRSAGELATELKLCTLPEAQQLLRPGDGSVVVRSRRWGLPILLTLAMTPNILAGIFNFIYNHNQIVTKLQDAQDPFWNVQAAINSIAYPLGVLLLGALYYPVVRAARRREELDDETAFRLRGRCLRLGQNSALISAAEWLVAGFAYPISMNAAGVVLAPADYVHFLISLALCGMIAATYPFFGVTAYAVHAIYPALLAPDDRLSAEAKRIQSLERRAWGFLAVGLLLPMFAVALVVAFGDEQFRFALSLLSVGSLLGCCGLFWAARRIQRDLGTLRDAIERL